MQTSRRHQPCGPARGSSRDQSHIGRAMDPLSFSQFIQAGCGNLPLEVGQLETNKDHHGRRCSCLHVAGIATRGFLD